MDTREAASRLYESLQVDFRWTIEDVAGGVQEDHRSILPQRILGDAGCVFRRIDHEPVCRTQLHDGGLSGIDRTVPKAFRAGEEQHPRWRRRFAGLQRETTNDE